ncbi:hypothetical protein NDU88_001910, partial [Pleurodeles waltl]
MEVWAGEAFERGLVDWRSCVVKARRSRRRERDMESGAAEAMRGACPGVLELAEHARV